MRGSCGVGWGQNRVGQILYFSNGFSSFPNGGPVLNSVVNLWGFCWGVWRPSESLGVGSGSWKDLKEEGRDSNWLCAEGSVCWRRRCGGSVMERHWGRPSLWGPGGILASGEDCHLEESLNCFLKRLEYLRREKKTRGTLVSLGTRNTKFVKQKCFQRWLVYPKRNRRDYNFKLLPNKTFLILRSF